MVGVGCAGYHGSTPWPSVSVPYSERSRSICGALKDAMPKFTIDPKINPATLLALAIATVSVIAGFAQARADINQTRERQMTDHEMLQALVEIEHEQQSNQAVTNQILKDYGRRIEKLEDR